jgi:hypothetical protein
MMCSGGPIKMNPGGPVITLALAWLRLRQGELYLPGLDLDRRTAGR